MALDGNLAGKLGCSLNSHANEFVSSATTTGSKLSIVLDLLV